MKRPPLRRVKLNWVLRQLTKPGPAGFCAITMSTGQWDKVLEGAYQARWVLLELDGNEKPVAAYRKAGGRQ